MSQYNNIFICREDFLDYKAKGIPYTGFVIGEGYAFVQYQEYYEDKDGTVMDINDNIPSYQICIPNIVQVQCIDTSKEMIKKSLRGLFSKNGCARYVVCEGDTLAYIAEMFDVTVEELKSWNELSSENSISIGQKLLIIDITERKIIDIPNIVENGEIKEAGALTSLEFWLDSPSDTFLEGIGKIAANVLYSMVNSPAVFFTGRTLAGASQLPEERFEAFLDIISFPFFEGVKAIGFCGKVEKGLNGYNQFLKTKQYKMYKPSGKGWQKEASKKFKQAREHYIMHIESQEFWNNMNYGFSIWNEYSKSDNND